MTPLIAIKTFIYNDQLHTRIIPSKRLFNSTMIHEVVNRGDIFALNIETSQFTIIPSHQLPPDVSSYNLISVHEPDKQLKAAQAKAKIRKLLEQINLELK